MEEHEHCIRCGRRLKNKEARQIGYGKVCAKKELKKQRLHIAGLFNIETKEWK